MRLCVDLLVNRAGNFILYASKETQYGYYVSCPPYGKYDRTEWEQVARYISLMMEEIKKDPITTEERARELSIDALTGVKKNKRMVKEYALIDISFDSETGIYEVANEPGLADGSYGYKIGHISEKFANKFFAKENCLEDLQQAIESALAEAKEYMKVMGWPF